MSIYLKALHEVSYFLQHSGALGKLLPYFNARTGMMLEMLPFFSPKWYDTKLFLLLGNHFVTWAGCKLFALKSLSKIMLILIYFSDVSEEATGLFAELFGRGF